MVSPYTCANTNLTSCFQGSSSQLETLFEAIRTGSSKNAPEEIYEQLKKKPSLLHETFEGMTLIEVLLFERILLQEMCFNACKNLGGWLALVIKIIELDPKINLDVVSRQHHKIADLSIAQLVIYCPPCNERTQLIKYLLFFGFDLYGAQITSMEKDKDIEDAQNDLNLTLNRVFNRGIEIFLLHQTQGIFPNDVIWNMALDAMCLEWPFLVNLPRETLIQRTCEHAKSSIPNFEWWKPSTFVGIKV